MSAAVDFFLELDERWKKTSSDPLDLKVIGAGALALLADLNRGTRDNDVLETEQVGAASKRLLEIGGPRSDLAKRHGLFIELVPQGMPFLPQGPRYIIPPGLEALRSIRVLALHPVEVAISKLKPFRAHDVADIADLARQNRLPHEDFLARFKSAVEIAELSARKDDLPEIIKRFHQVERDQLGVGPSPIELSEER